LAPWQADLLKGTATFVEGRVPDDSIWSVLHRECHVLFRDELFDDLFDKRGRRSVPPRIVAVVMVLQRLHGLSDREAVEAFEFDARWKYACGGLDFDYPGFVHTVLIDMRARLARSDRPRRIFEVSLDAARRAGIVSARRVLDSTPIYDAVATMDTVTMIRSAIRRLLAVAGSDLRAELRAVLCRDDDYGSGGKPSCDWDDPAAREALVAELAVDGFACLEVIEGRELDVEVAEAAELLATVIGQDLEAGDDGVFRIARNVAKDRIISTVDPETRHGRKSAARGFDGYKGHAAVDPDSEIITDTVVTAGATPVTPPSPPSSSTTFSMTTPRRSRRSTGTPPTGPANSNSASRTKTLPRGVGLSHRQRLVVCSPRTASSSISTMTPSPAPTTSLSPSAAAPTAAAPRTSPSTARTVHCARSAPTPPADARSASSRTRLRSHGPALVKPTPTGRPTTGPPDPRSNASSAT
jgi:hypothetical protein